MLLETLNDYLRRCQTATGSGVSRVLDEMKSWQKENPPVPAEVCSLLRKLLSEGDFPATSLVFCSAWSSLSQDYIPILIEILSSESLAGWHEQTVELLAALPSPNAVAALRRALDYRWDYDEWSAVPRKALAALHAIGTPDALSAVKLATHAKEELIRQDALAYLRPDGA